MEWYSGSIQSGMGVCKIQLHDRALQSSASVCCRVEKIPKSEGYRARCARISPVWPSSGHILGRSTQVALKSNGIVGTYNLAKVYIDNGLYFVFCLLKAAVLGVNALSPSSASERAVAPGGRMSELDRRIGRSVGRTIRPHRGRAPASQRCENGTPSPSTAPVE